MSQNFVLTGKFFVSIDRSINQSINQSINKSINKSITQPTNQPTNQSINQSIRQQYLQFNDNHHSILCIYYNSAMILNEVIVKSFNRLT
jgi:hypothetical protein